MVYFLKTFLFLLLVSRIPNEGIEKLGMMVLQGNFQSVRI